MNPNITSHLILFRCVHTFYKRVCAVQFYRGLRLKHLTGSCSIFRLLRLRQNVGSKLKQKFPKELKTTVFSNNVTRENLLKLLVSSFLISSELCYPHRSSHLTSWVLIFKKKKTSWVQDKTRAAKRSQDHDASKHRFISCLRLEG